MLIHFLKNNNNMSNKENPVPSLDNIIKAAIYTLNNIPNTPNVGPKGESSYEVIKSLEIYLQNGVETK